MSTLTLTRWSGQSSRMARRLGQWWLREFLGPFPAGLLDRLLGRNHMLLAIEPTADGVTFALTASQQRSIATTRISAADYRPSLVEEFLRTNGVEPAQVCVGLTLPPKQFFVRTLLLPASVGERVGDIAVKDLLLKTPFRLDDICHGHSAMPASDPDKVAVWQWVVKREFVEAALSTTSLPGGRISFVCAPGGSYANVPAPLVWLGASATNTARWPRKVVAALAAIAVALVLVSGVQKYLQQEVALDQLDAQIAATRAKAQQVRLTADGFEQRRKAIARLYARKSERPGLLEIWEETTRLLPSHSFLTELRLSESADGRERRIALTGFSEAATGLIAILDGSPLFSNVALTAPVAADPLEKRERFALQAAINLARPVKEASR